MSQYDELKGLLDSESGERDVVKWLKHDRENTLLLLRAVSTFGFPNLVVAEFQLGTDHKADFVLLGRFSGGFSIHFVEVESPDIPLLQQKGCASPRLAEAIKQIEDWKSFERTKRPVVIDELEKSFKKRELIWGKSRVIVENTGKRLHDPDVWLRFHYHIVIGRRNALSSDETKRKAAAFTHNEIDTMTFDRLLEYALNERGEVTGSDFTPHEDEAHSC
jgi:hypothetical protein